MTMIFAMMMTMRKSSRAGREAPAWRSVLVPRGSRGVLRDAFLLGALALLPGGAHAQKHSKHAAAKAVPDIVAEGHVVNHAKAPVANAVVYLENPNSLAIKSYLTDQNGHFHFNELSPQTDYEVWAEQNGVESKHKFISQFSSHTKFDFTLRLNPGHGHKLLGFL